MANGTVGNLQIEPMWALAGAAMNSLVLYGFINQGDLTVTVTPTWTDQMVHQGGTHVVQKYFNGKTAVAEFELAEVLNYAMWEEVFPTGEHQMDDATPPQARFAFDKVLATEPYVGQKGTALAQFFVFRPMRLYTDTSTETVGDIVISQGLSVGPVVLTGSTENPMVLPFEVHGIWNPAATEGEDLVHYGITDGTFEIFA